MSPGLAGAFDLGEEVDMHTPDLAEMFSVSSNPPAVALPLEQIGVDGDGNVQLLQRNEDGSTVSSHSWAPSTDVAGTVHTMIEWLSRGAPGAFADFTF